MENSFNGGGNTSNNSGQEVKELANTIKVASGMNQNKANIVYVNPPEGINVMGLVAIKNCTKNTAKGPAEALRFVFKHKDIENCFVTHTVTSKLHEKSNLFKCMQSMLPGLMDPMPDASKAFAMLKELIGGWFNVMVSMNEFMGKTGTKIKKCWIVGAYIKPADTGLGDCRVYFHDRKQPVNATVVEVSSGFENYPEAKTFEVDTEKYKFVYDLSQIKPEKLESAKKLVVSQSGVVHQDNTGAWKGYSPTEITPLFKYRVATPEDDQNPF